jgi:hypothetical protein
MDVVPEVNWIFTISVGERPCGGSGRISGASSDNTDEKVVMDLYEDVSTRPASL